MKNLNWINPFEVDRFKLFVDIASIEFDDDDDDDYDDDDDDDDING